MLFALAVFDAMAASTVEEAIASETDEEGGLDVAAGALFEFEREIVLLGEGALDVGDMLESKVLCCDD